MSDASANTDIERPSAHNGSSGASFPERRAVLVVSALAVLTVAVFFPVRTFEFTLFDDNAYVTDNAIVQRGLTWSGAVWAFTTFHTGNWHPLTWLSHMLDAELWGLDPGSHHLVNVAFHAVNTALLFIVLYGRTNGFWASAFAAALFAVHPLHVESVAWVAERKDVLSTFFWLLAIAAYTWYVRNPGRLRYAAVAVAMTLGLLAKPMVVTLPVVLLLLDYWPLARWMPGSGMARLRQLMWEKAPLMGLAGIFSAITLYAQRAGGNVAGVEHLPVAARLGNAVLSYARYLELTVWPHGLAPLYPHPLSAGGSMPWLEVGISAAAVGALTGVAVWAGTRHKYLVTGWLWFLVTLAPVIGVIQVGRQAIADRYMYIPSIGLFAAAAWGLATWAGPSRRRSLAAAAAAGLVLVAAIAATRAQLPYWRNTATLFERALAVTERNAGAHQQLGAAYARSGRLSDAEAQFRAALAIAPHSLEARNNLGIVLAQSGRPAEAAEVFREGLARRPHDATLHANLARALRQQGSLPEAIAHYREAVRLDPEAWQVASALAWLLATHSDPLIRNGTEAVALAQRADRLTGHSAPNVLDALAAAYAETGRFAEAVQTAERAAGLALAAGRAQLAQAIRARAALYRMGQPYYAPASDSREAR